MFKIVHTDPEVTRVHRVSTKEDKILGTFDFGELTFDTIKEAKDLIQENEDSGILMMADHLSVVKV